MGRPARINSQDFQLPKGVFTVVIHEVQFGRIVNGRLTKMEVTGEARVRLLSLAKAGRILPPGVYLCRLTRDEIGPRLQRIDRCDVDWSSWRFRGTFPVSGNLLSRSA